LGHFAHGGRQFESQALLKVDYTAIFGLHDRFKPVAGTHARAAHFKPPDNNLFRKSEREGERSKSVGVVGGKLLRIHLLSLRPASVCGTRGVSEPGCPLVRRRRTIPIHNSHEWMTSVNYHAVTTNCTRDSLELRS
jgi:hypothetical protein